MSTKPPTPTPFNVALRDADPEVQNGGVAAAVAIGADAVPDLLALLRDPGAARAQVMYVLAEVADPRARDVFSAGAVDADEAVRAQAARGLARLGDPAALEACLEAINDAADILHLDRTPAVEALGNMGLAAVPGLLELMDDADDMTRLRAQRALELVLAQRHGLQPGRDSSTLAAEAAMQAEWRANGSYDYGASAKKRRAALRRWRAWLEQQR